MNYILNGLIDYYKINMAFIEYYDKFPQARKNYERVVFSVYGSFPQVSYGGERNSLSGLCLYNDIVLIFQEYHEKSMNLILDCSSFFINELNYYDVLGNMIISQANNYPDTYIIVGNDFAYNYFRTNYNNCNFIKARNYKEIDTEKEFFGISSNIPISNYPKHRQYLYINDLCSKFCPKEKCLKCSMQEQLNIVTFSNSSVYKDCFHLNTNIHKNIMNYNDLDTLYNQGYKNFIAPYLNFVISQITEYVKDLILPEYQIEAINYILLKLGY